MTVMTGRDYVARRHDLLYEFFGRHRHAVVIRPAIYSQPLIATVAVIGGRIGRLSFERGCAPWIAAGRLAIEVRPHEIKEEYELNSRDEHSGDRDPLVRFLDTGRNELDAAAVRIVAARHAEDAEVVHRQIDGVG